jgi:hypothetical protein
MPVREGETGMSVSREIERLKALRADGTLSDAEYEAAKAKALGGAVPRVEARRARGGTSWALWVLLVVVVVASGAVLVMLEEISRSVELVAGGVGVLAAAGGAVMSVMEDVSVAGVLAFALVGAAIGAVVFAAMAPVLIVAALVALPVALAWGWIEEMFNG